MARADEEKKADDLRSQGYFPFGWGDFYNTGYSAKEAAKQESGFHKSSAKANQLVWDTTGGPRGGCWIRYRRESQIKGGTI